VGGSGLSAAITFCANLSVPKDKDLLHRGCEGDPGVRKGGWSKASGTHREKVYKWISKGAQDAKIAQGGVKFVENIGGVNRHKSMTDECTIRERNTQIAPKGKKLNEAATHPSPDLDGRRRNLDACQI